MTALRTPREVQQAAAKVAISFLVGDPRNGVPLRSPSPHEISAAILALVVEDDAGGWRPAEEAPDGWHRTFRLGEARASISHKRTFPGEDPEWSAPDGRTTVTHSAYAAPTHYLAWPVPPLPEPPTTPTATEIDNG